MIASQSRQVNFSRTVWITFHWRGITSSVSVMSSPSFASFAEPQQGQLVGASMTTRSRADVSGRACATGRLRWKERTVCVLAAAASAASSSSVAAASSSSSCEFHLIEKPRLALRARAVERALQLLDLKLEMRDQRLSVRQVRRAGRSAG